MKITALAAILLLAVLLASPFINSYNAYSLSQTFQAVSFWGSSSAPLLASPGSSNLPLTIQVINVGPNTVFNASVSFVPKQPLLSLQGQQSNLTAFMPVFRQGGSLSITGYFDIQPNATSGIYN